MRRWVGNLHVGQLVILWLGLCVVSGALMVGWMFTMDSASTRPYTEANRVAPAMTQDDKAQLWESLVAAGRSHSLATTLVNQAASARDAQRDSIVRAVQAAPSFFDSIVLWLLGLVALPLLGIPATAWMWFGARRRSLEPTP